MQIVIDVPLTDGNLTSIVATIQNWQRSLGEPACCLIHAGQEHPVVIVPTGSESTADLCLTQLQVPHHFSPTVLSLGSTRLTVP